MAPPPWYHDRNNRIHPIINALDVNIVDLVEIFMLVDSTLPMWAIHIIDEDVDCRVVL